MFVSKHQKLFDRLSRPIDVLESIVSEINKRYNLDFEVINSFPQIIISGYIDDADPVVYVLDLLVAETILEEIENAT